MAPADIAPRLLGTLWVLNLGWPLPTDLAPRVPATFVRVGPEAAGSLARAMGHAEPALALERFAAGRHCYAARVQGEIAAYGWVSFDEEQIGELGLRIRLVPGEAYIWDCATAPAYRRRRLYTALLAHIVGELRGAGLCRAWIGADEDNQASQGGMALAGFQPVADLIIDSTLEMNRIRVTGRPGAPEQIVADARFALLGDPLLASEK